MKIFLPILMTLMMAGIMCEPAVAKDASPAKPAKPAPAKQVCVAKAHVIYGCKTCEAMMDWLKKGGVKLDIQDVQTGPYKLYPTIIYSDKSSDNGEKMYQHVAQIPSTLCVVRCNVGME